MNERIKELMIQADYPAPELALRAHRLAELIVRKCIDIADKEDFDVMMKEGYPCSQTAKKIQEHFGVSDES
jgi:hypothetical protein